LSYVDVQCLEELYSVILYLNLVFLGNRGFIYRKYIIELLEIKTRLAIFLLHLLLFDHHLLLLKDDLESVELDLCQFV